MRQIIYILILYAYLFSPHFYFLGGKGLIKVLYPLLFILFISKQSQNILLHLKNVVFIFSLIITFVFLRTGFNGEYSYISSSIVAVIEVVLLPVAILTLMTNKENNFIHYLLLTGGIAASISALALFIPNVREWILNKTITSEYIENVLHRGFGLGESLTYSFSITLAIILIIGIMNIKEYRWIAFLIPLFMIGIFLNARIGILVTIVGLIFSFKLDKAKTTFKMLLSFSLITIIVYKLLISQGTISDSQTDFVLQFWLELKDFIFGTNEAKNSTANALFGRMWVLPETYTEWIIGSGRNIFTGHQRTSDVGYILQLNYGGVIYLLLLSALILSIFKLAKWEHNSKLFLFLLLTILISNIKGEFILNTGSFRLITLLVLYYQNKQHKGLTAHRSLLTIKSSTY